jgi:hypothetical protein
MDVNFDFNYSIPTVNYPAITNGYITTTASIYTITSGSSIWGDPVYKADTITAKSDIKIGDVSIKDLLETIMERLAILQPDPAKLEKYEALRKAYDHYKLMEKLLHE